MGRGEIWNINNMNNKEEADQWEREHDFKIIWRCPQCDYSYESPRYENEALRCPDCKCPTLQSGESYGC